MHRTPTTAAILVTVAVSALAGCVTVQRPPLPGPVVAPSQPPVPRPEGQAETQVVQAPAREALEMVGPSRRPTPTTPTRQPRTAKAAAPAEQQPPPRPRSHPHPRPARPEPRRPTQPRVRIPDVEEEVRRNTDVCALGRKYGGWQGDSPEAVICEQAYGR